MRGMLTCQPSSAAVDAAPGSTTIGSKIPERLSSPSGVSQP